MKDYLPIFLLLCSTGWSACGASYKIRSISRDPVNDGNITVNFITSSAPPQAEAQDKTSWHVTATTPTGQVAGTVQAVTINDFKIGRTLTLTVCYTDSSGACSNSFSDGTTSYMVIFASKSGTAQISEPYQRASTNASTTAPSSSTVHLSGGINPAVGAAPTYNIDSAVDLHPGGSDFGVTGSVKTDNRKKVDPDSFLAALVWNHVLSTPPVPAGGGQIFFQGVIMQCNCAGVEFARTGKDLNFVTAPSIVLPFSLNSLDSTGSVVNTWNLELRMGAEGGYNFENSLNSNGYGGFLRTKLGASNVFIFRKVAGFDHIEIDSSYDVRLPYKKELFGVTNATGTEVYSLSSKARHYLTNTLTLALNKNWGIAITHKYGSLPPTFNFVNHTLTIGLSYTYPAPASK
jgi:hypothetical protein